MNNLERIQKLLESAGPSLKEELVYEGTQAKGNTPQSDDYQEFGKFTFKRLSFYEMDKLRLHSVNDRGRFDPNLHAGSNARLLAATIVDENGNGLFSEQDINQWPPGMVDAFAAAANRVNGNIADAQKVLAKNSDATEGATP